MYKPINEPFPAWCEAMALSYTITDRMTRIRMQTTSRLIAVREVAFVAWATKVTK